MSWKNFPLDDTSFTNALALDPTSPRVVYAGTDDGLYKTADGGHNWQRVCLRGKNVDALAIDASARVLYVVAGPFATNYGSIYAFRLRR